jgi:hypothetical protein
MGSIITLGIGKLEIDWGKNWNFINHSRLFLPSDIKQLPYYYVDNYMEYKPGFGRKLKDVKRRLELLGYTLPKIRRLYDEAIYEMPDYYDDPEIDFDMFARAVKGVDANKVQLNDEYEDYDLGEYVAKNIFQDPEFHKTEEELKSLTENDGTFFENLDPYITLRLLMENPNNLELDLGWRYSDVVGGGWISESDLYKSLTDTERYLVVTEGSSDLFILRKSLELLAPDILDFFYFVDMAENYPFTGTGNLYRFCQGLASIKIQNKVLVIFDNDTAGKEKYELSSNLSLPENMKIAILPSLSHFENFLCVGPNGETRENINQRAVAIENFLDLNYASAEEPRIRWHAYNEKMDAYQGSLINKDKYVRLFAGVQGKNATYDFSKLKTLVDFIYEQCIA